MRLGVIGLGRIGAFHVDTLTRLDRVDSPVVTDAVPAVTASVAARFGADNVESVRTARLLRRVLGERVTALAVVDVLRGLPWVLRERDPCPPISRTATGGWSRCSSTAARGPTSREPPQRLGARPPGGGRSGPLAARTRLTAPATSSTSRWTTLGRVNRALLGAGAPPVATATMRAGHVLRLDLRSGSEWLAYCTGDFDDGRIAAAASYIGLDSVVIDAGANTGLWAVPPARQAAGGRRQACERGCSQLNRSRATPVACGKICSTTACATWLRSCRWLGPTTRGASSSLCERTSRTAPKRATRRSRPGRWRRPVVQPPGAAASAGRPAAGTVSRRADLGRQSRPRGAR
jgi:hypothetical protein